MSSCAASDLCIKCGACCDGTAFGQVPLEDTDLVDVSMGMNLLEAGGKRVLKQPCAAHINNTCTIYSQRPSICSDYECKLLKEYMDGEVSVYNAHEAIDRLKSLKREIEMLLKTAGTENDRDDIHLKMWSLEKEALTRLTIEQFHNLHRPLLLKYEVLKRLLTNSFGVVFKRESSFAKTIIEDSTDLG
ncbi:MAG: YkgJ family cysteine cluster protein [Roseivirga sp.]|nr:YkgJ family cysteine cluster protein [Roseivirga sp.]